jgi:hypothetical protein
VRLVISFILSLAIHLGLFCLMVYLLLPPPKIVKITNPSGTGASLIVEVDILSNDPWLDPPKNSYNGIGVYYIEENEFDGEHFEKRHVVTEVVKGYPAAAAGIKENDIILVDDLEIDVKSHAVGEKVNLKIKRGNLVFEKILTIAKIYLD